jgi:fructose-specific phosphotransferase system IIC component
MKFIIVYSGRFGGSLLQTRRRRIMAFTCIVILICVLIIALASTLSKAKKVENHQTTKKPTGPTSKNFYSNIINQW